MYPSATDDGGRAPASETMIAVAARTTTMPAMARTQRSGARPLPDVPAGVAETGTWPESWLGVGAPVVGVAPRSSIVVSSGGRGSVISVPS